MSLFEENDLGAGTYSGEKDQGFEQFLSKPIQRPFQPFGGPKPQVQNSIAQPIEQPQEPSYQPANYNTFQNELTPYSQLTQYHDKISRFRRENETSAKHYEGLYDDFKKNELTPFFESMGGFGDFDNDDDFIAAIDELEKNELKTSQIDDGFFGGNEDKKLLAQENLKKFGNWSQPNGLRDKMMRLRSEAQGRRQTADAAKAEEFAAFESLTSIPMAARDAMDEQLKAQSRAPRSKKATDELLNQYNFESPSIDLGTGEVLNIESIDPRRKVTGFDLGTGESNKSVKRQRQRMAAAQRGDIQGFLSKRALIGRERQLRDKGFFFSQNGLIDGRPIGLSRRDVDLLDIADARKAGVEEYEGKPLEQAFEELGGEDRLKNAKTLEGVYSAKSNFDDAKAEYMKVAGSDKAEAARDKMEAARGQMDEVIGLAAQDGLDNELFEQAESVGFLSALGNAVKRGMLMSEMSNYTPDFLTNTLDADEIERFIEIASEIEKLPTSETMKRVKATKSDGFLDAMGNLLFDNPMAIPEMFVESMASFLPTTIKMLIPSAGAGALIGTAIAPGAGTAAGAVWGARASWGVASFVLEASGMALEGMQELGIDWKNPKVFAASWSNEAIRKKIQKKMVQKGTPIAVADMLTGMMAGRVMAVANHTGNAMFKGGKLLNKAEFAKSAGAVPRFKTYQKVRNAAAELGFDSTMGMSGEYMGQWASKEPGEDWDWDAIAAEGLVGVGPGILSSALEMRSPKANYFSNAPIEITDERETETGSMGTITRAGYSAPYQSFNDADSMVQYLSGIPGVNPESLEFTNGFLQQMYMAKPEEMSRLKVALSPRTPDANLANRGQFDSRDGQDVIYINEKEFASDPMGAFMHESGHFARVFILTDRELATVWESLGEDAQLEAYAQYFTKQPEVKFDSLPENEQKKIRTAFSRMKRTSPDVLAEEWFSYQWGRVLNGMTADKNVAANLKTFKNKILHSALAPYIGTEALAGPKSEQGAILDQRIKEFLGQENAMPDAATPDADAPQANPTPQTKEQTERKLNAMPGTPQEKSMIARALNAMAGQKVLTESVSFFTPLQRQAAVTAATERRLREAKKEKRGKTDVSDTVVNKTESDFKFTEKPEPPETFEPDSVDNQNIDDLIKEARANLDKAKEIEYQDPKQKKERLKKLQLDLKSLIARKKSEDTQENVSEGGKELPENLGTTPRSKETPNPSKVAKPKESKPATDAEKEARRKGYAKRSSLLKADTKKVEQKRKAAANPEKPSAHKKFARQAPPESKETEKSTEPGKSTKEEKFLSQSSPFGEDMVKIERLLPKTDSEKKAVKDLVKLIERNKKLVSKKETLNAEIKKVTKRLKKSGEDLSTSRIVSEVLNLPKMMELSKYSLASLIRNQVNPDASLSKPPTNQDIEDTANELIQEQEDILQMLNNRLAEIDREIRSLEEGPKAEGQGVQAEIKELKKSRALVLEFLEMIAPEELSVDWQDIPHPLLMITPAVKRKGKKIATGKPERLTLGQLATLKNFDNFVVTRSARMQGKDVFEEAKRSPQEILWDFVTEEFDRSRGPEVPKESNPYYGLVVDKKGNSRPRTKTEYTMILEAVKASAQASKKEEIGSKPMGTVRYKENKVADGKKGGGFFEEIYEQVKSNPRASEIKKTRDQLEEQIKASSDPTELKALRQGVDNLDNELNELLPTTYTKRLQEAARGYPAGFGVDKGGNLAAIVVERMRSLGLREQPYGSNPTLEDVLALYAARGMTLEAMGDPSETRAQFYQNMFQLARDEILDSRGKDKESSIPIDDLADHAEYEGDPFPKVVTGKSFVHSLTAIPSLKIRQKFEIEYYNDLVAKAQDLGWRPKGKDGKKADLVSETGVAESKPTKLPMIAESKYDLSGDTTEKMRAESEAISNYASNAPNLTQLERDSLRETANEIFETVVSLEKTESLIKWGDNTIEAVLDDPLNYFKTRAAMNEAFKKTLNNGKFDYGKLSEYEYLGPFAEGGIIDERTGKYGHDKFDAEVIYEPLDIMNLYAKGRLDFESPLNRAMLTESQNEMLDIEVRNSIKKMKASKFTELYGNDKKYTESRSVKKADDSVEKVIKPIKREDLLVARSKMSPAASQLFEELKSEKFRRGRLFGNLTPVPAFQKNRTTLQKNEVLFNEKNDIEIEVDPAASTNVTALDIVELYMQGNPVKKMEQLDQIPSSETKRSDDGGPAQLKQLPGGLGEGLLVYVFPQFLSEMYARLGIRDVEISSLQEEADAGDVRSQMQIINEPEAKKPKSKNEDFKWRFERGDMYFKGKLVEDFNPFLDDDSRMTPEEMAAAVEPIVQAVIDARGIDLFKEYDKYENTLLPRDPQRGAEVGVTENSELRDDSGNAEATQSEKPIRVSEDVMTAAEQASVVKNLEANPKALKDVDSKLLEELLDIGNLSQDLKNIIADEVANRNNIKDADDLFGGSPRSLNSDAGKPITDLNVVRKVIALTKKRIPFDRIAKLGSQWDYDELSKIHFKARDRSTYEGGKSDVQVAEELLESLNSARAAMAEGDAERAQQETAFIEKLMANDTVMNNKWTDIFGDEEAIDLEIEAQSFGGNIKDLITKARKFKKDGTSPRSLNSDAGRADLYDFVDKPTVGSVLRKLANEVSTPERKKYIQAAVSAFNSLKDFKLETEFEDVGQNTTRSFKESSSVRVSDIPVRYLKDNESRGAAAKYTEADIVSMLPDIAIRKEHFLNKNPESVSYGIIHEAFHGATIDRLYNLGLFRDAAAQNRERKKDTPAARLLRAYDIARAKAGVDGTQSVSTLAEKGLYGLTSFEEFLADALSKNNLIKFLDSIEAPTNAKMSLFDELINAIKDLLGLKIKGTLLGDVIKNLSEFTEQQTADIDSRQGEEYRPMLNSDAGISLTSDVNPNISKVALLGRVAAGSKEMKEDFDNWYKDKSESVKKGSFKLNFVDRTNPLHEAHNIFTKAFEEVGLPKNNPLSNYLNVRGRFHQYFGKGDDAVEQANLEYYEPIMDLMREYNVDEEKFGRYLMFRAAPSRNLQIETKAREALKDFEREGEPEKNEQYKKIRDYFFKKEGDELVINRDSGVKTKDALEALQDMEKDPKFVEFLNKALPKYYSMNKSGIKDLADAGMLQREVKEAKQSLDEVKAMTEAMSRFDFMEGTADKYGNAYKSKVNLSDNYSYAPLQGFEGETEQFYDHEKAWDEFGGGRGNSGKGFDQPKGSIILKGAFGRPAGVGPDPKLLLGNSFNQHMSNMIKAKKNEVAKEFGNFYGMVRNILYGKEESLVYFSERSMDPAVKDTYDQLLKLKEPGYEKAFKEFKDEFEKIFTKTPFQETKETFSYETPETNSSINIVRREISSKFQDSQSVFVFRNNGVPVFIQLADTAEGLAMADALKNLRYESLPSVLQGFNVVTRGMAQMFTSANIAFMLPNFFRDVGTAAIHLAEDDKKVLIKDALNPKNLGAFIKEIYKAERMKQKGINPNTQDADVIRLLKNEDPSEILKSGNRIAQWQYFRAQGAKVGYFRHPSLPEKVRKIQKDLKGKGWAKESWKQFWDLVDAMNTAIENSIRASTFWAAIKDGRPPDEAAVIARNVTVDFNQKGNLTQAFGALYVFFGASVNSAHRLFTTIARRSPKERAALLGGIAGAALIVNLFNRLMDDDEDEEMPDYDTISTYKRDTNFILPMPAGLPGFFNDEKDTGYLSMPLPLGYNLFWAMGQVMGDMIAKNVFERGGTGVFGGTTRVQQAALQAFNPIGGASLMTALSPTASTPIMELWANKNFMDRPIRQGDRPFEVPKPAHLQDPKSTPEHWTTLSRGINSMLGGSDDVKGSLKGFAGQNPLMYSDDEDLKWDVSGSQMKHLFYGYLGGPGMIADTMFGGLLSSGQNIRNVGDIPVANRFMRATTYGSTTREVFYDVRDAVKNAEKAIKNAKNISPKIYQGVLRDNKELVKMSGAISAFDKQKNKLNRLKKQVEGSKGLSEEQKTQRVDAIRKKELELMIKVIKQAQTLGVR